MDRPPKTLWRKACPRRCRWARRLTSPRRSSGLSCLTPSHFELPPQDPIQQAEQAECRSNQNRGVESKNADARAEIAFFCAEENVRTRAAAIVALLHLRIRN